MAFPDTPLDVLVALYYDGAWHTVTQDALSREPITIERGRADEAQRVDPTKCRLLFNNGASKVAPGVTGRYSPRNPYSDLFGKIGRNTPVKVSVNAGTPWLALTGTALDRARTPDAAALDITGDIDIRMELTPSTWHAGSDPIELAGKWGAAGSRSWILTLWQGGLLLYWSVDGTANLNAPSTADLTPPPSGRMAVRATLDVDNGSGGRTVTYYTAPSIDGPWTQLGAPVTAAGTTSIFSSDAAVDVGAVGNVTFTNPAGRFHAFQLRNGIAGTLVADVDFTAQEVGDTSFADDTGLTWTLENSAAISNEHIRFLGEISNWPPRWDVSGKDAWMPVEAAGIMRRLGQGASPLRSVMLREMTADDATRPEAYWPVEDASGASSVASGLGGTFMSVTGAPDFAAFSEFACSDPICTMKTGSALTGRVSAYTVTGQTQVRWLQAVPDSGGPVDNVLLRLDTTGTAARWDLVYRTGGGLELIIYDDSGTQIGTSGNVAFGVDGKRLRLSLELTQDGADIDYNVATQDVDGIALVDPNTLAGRTVGRVWKVTVAPELDIDSVSYGHIAVYSVITPIGDLGQQTRAWNGEAAGRRIERLCEENGIAFATHGGSLDDTELMGPQRSDTLLNLLQAAADADVSALLETRDQVGLACLPRTALYNQAPALELSYTTDGHISPPFEPAEDDQALKNQITAGRDGGSSAIVSEETGPLSILAPPDGVGLYDSSVTVNVKADGQLTDQAGWRVHLGTVDEPRYPVIHIDLAAAPQLIDAVCELDTGLRLTVSDAPVWVPPEDVDQLVQGYREVIGHPNDWDLYVNCVPYSPYAVGVYDSGHRQTSGSELVTAVDSDDTTLTVRTTTGLIWTTESSDMPFDVVVGGERMSVSAIASWLADAFGRSSASSWGSADSGQAWSTVGGGSASDYNVGSGYGSHTLSTVDVTRRTAITAAHADCDFYGSITTSALATGASLYGALTARMLDSGNLYMARLEFTTSNTVVLAVRKIVVDVQTELGAYTVPVTHAAGVFIRVRFQVTGSTLRAKAWPATEIEPDRWNITATDTSITAANSLGTRSITVTGNTNGTTVQVRYDNFDVADPQRMTVTRSVNGIVKSHAAGAAVAVYRPAVRAL